MSYILEKLGLKQQSCPCLIASKSDAIKFEIHLSCRNLAEEIFGTFHSLTKCEASFDIASAMPLFFFWDLEWRFYLGGDCGLAVPLQWKQLSFETWIFGWRLFDCFLLDMSFYPLVPWWRFSIFNMFQSILKQQNVTKLGKLEILKFSSNIQQEQRSTSEGNNPVYSAHKLDGHLGSKTVEPNHFSQEKNPCHFPVYWLFNRDPGSLNWFSKIPHNWVFPCPHLINWYPPKTNMSPEKYWLKDYFPFNMAPF